jgi:Leucine-rich repeat (LRR) protein
LAHRIDTFNTGHIAQNEYQIKLLPSLIIPFNTIEGIESLSNLYTLLIQHTNLNNFNPPSALSTVLDSLDLSKNLLTTFNPTQPLPNNLYFLRLNNNQITIFEPTLQLPQVLFLLDLSSNLITSFNPSQPLLDNLTTLNLSNNLLTSFNPTQPLPTTLDTINLYYNNLNTSNVNTALYNLSNITWTSTPPSLLDIRQNPAAPPSVGPPNGIQAKTNLQAVGWTVTTD